MSRQEQEVRRTSLHLHFLLLVGLLTASGSTFATCFEAASTRYRVPAPLLRAIAEQESGNNPRAVGKNTNGSRDIGLMQINSSWLPFLSRYRISEQNLYDPCVSVMVGAWILQGNFARIGYSTQGLGAYNAGNPVLRERYAAQVLRRVPRYLPASPPQVYVVQEDPPPTN